MLPRKMGPLMSHLRRLLSELSMNPPFLVAMSSATVSVFVDAVFFFVDDFMLMTCSKKRRQKRLRRFSFLLLLSPRLKLKQVSIQRPQTPQSLRRGSHSRREGARLLFQY